MSAQRMAVSALLCSSDSRTTYPAPLSNQNHAVNACKPSCIPEIFATTASVRANYTTQPHYSSPPSSVISSDPRSCERDRDEIPTVHLGVTATQYANNVNSRSLSSREAALFSSNAFASRSDGLFLLVFAAEASAAAASSQKFRQTPPAESVRAQHVPKACSKVNVAAKTQASGKSSRPSPGMQKAIKKSSTVPKYSKSTFKKKGPTVLPAKLVASPSGIGHAVAVQRGELSCQMAAPLPSRPPTNKTDDFGSPNRSQPMFAIPAASYQGSRIANTPKQVLEAPAVARISKTPKSTRTTRRRSKDVQNSKHMQPSGFIAHHAFSPSCTLSGGSTVVDDAPMSPPRRPRQHESQVPLSRASQQHPRRTLVASDGHLPHAFRPGTVSPLTGKQESAITVRHVDPRLVRRPWTQEEDALIVEAHRRMGNRWSAIARNLPGRTDNAVKNRFNSALRAKLGRNDPPNVSKQVSSV